MSQRRANKPAGAAKGQPSLRIIGGRWRGRKLPIAAVDGLRPSGDRIRETLFNWLQAEIPGARVLDLFAGTGSLGIEALSRGAGETVLIERDTKAAGLLRDNLKLLQAECGHIVQGDSLNWLDSYTGPSWDIVFIDPPFALELWHQSFDRLEREGLLSPNALIYVECERDRTLNPPADWQLYREKRAGQVCYRLYSLNRENSQ